MRPRLRRSLRAWLGPDRGLPAELRELLVELEAGSREEEEERALLEGALATLTALLHRARPSGAAAPPEAPRKKPKPVVLRASLAALELPLFDLGPRLEVRFANRAAERLCGCAPGAAAGERLFALLAPAPGAGEAAAWERRLLRGEPVAGKLSCAARDGRALACDFALFPRQRPDGSVRGVRAIVRDETGRAAPASAAGGEEAVRHAVAAAGDALFDWQPSNGKLHLGAAWGRLAGLSGKGAGDQSDWIDRVHPEDLSALWAAVEAHLGGKAEAFECEHRVRHGDGTWRWLVARGAAVRDGPGEVRLVGLISDVTQRRERAERMAHDARHDPLTGLPNRTLFLDLLRHSFLRTRRHEEYQFAVFFMDVDSFKSVNDELGHQAGDELLMQIAKRLERCRREGDTLARHGGDEFTMWLDDVPDPRSALAVAERIHATMAEPFSVAGRAVRSSVSIGVGVCSARHRREDEVLREADAAMYRAKALGGGKTALFEQRVTQKAGGSGADLQRALAEGQLRVHYLPIVDTKSGDLLGLEALARWQHPTRGLVPPDQFLDLAVETGLIVPLDEWVLKTASHQLRDWRRELASAAGVALSVNLSQELLQRKDLDRQIGRALQEASLAPGDLNVDISERALANPAPLVALRAAGVGLHMDDFGSGSGWLSHLHSREIDSVKLDQAYLSQLTPAGGDRVLRSIVALAQSLGKRVVAEGIETEDQLASVRAAGCNSAQGYLFSRPLSAVEARVLLQNAGPSARPKA